MRFQSTHNNNNNKNISISTKYFKHVPCCVSHITLYLYILIHLLKLSTSVSTCETVWEIIRKHLRRTILIYFCLKPLKVLGRPKRFYRFEHFGIAQSPHLIAQSHLQNFTISPKRTHQKLKSGDTLPEIKYGRLKCLIVFIPTGT
jgi:hypothetical protein